VQQECKISKQNYCPNIFLIKAFMLGITIQLGISARLIPQLTTNICHHIRKLLLKKGKRKKIQKIYGGLDQNPYVNKNYT